MTRKTILLLAFALAGGLALGIFGLRHFGKPHALTKDARDTHRYDDHDHPKRLKAVEHHDDHKKHAHEGHGHGKHGHDEHGHDEEGVIRISESGKKNSG